MEVQFPQIGLSLDVERVAFSLFGFNVYWYGICICLGFALAILVGVRVMKKHYNQSVDKMLDIVLISAVFAVIGARLYYVIFNFSEFEDDLLKIFSLRTGGLAIYGGIIGAFLAGYITCRIMKYNVRAMFDVAAIGFSIGQGIGRWGNFFNQEAFGSNTNLPWGMYSQNTYDYLLKHSEELAASGVTVDPTMPVHPCFLYESIWCLLGFAVLMFMVKRRKFDGQVFLTYGIWYGVGRFFIEGLRTDSLMTLSGVFRVSQILSLIIVIVCAVLMFVSLRKLKAPSDEEYVSVFSAQTDIDEDELSEADEEDSSEADDSNDIDSILGEIKDEDEQDNID